MDFEIRDMSIDQYNLVYELWENSEGVGLSQSDSRCEIEKFLMRNPGLCFTAWMQGALVGAILCGHDGRRGYIHHLAVEAKARKRGVGSALVDRCLKELKERGISKCHLFVFTDNNLARTFWTNLDWIPRDELILMSQYT